MVTEPKTRAKGGGAGGMVRDNPDIYFRSPSRTTDWYAKLT